MSNVLVFVLELIGTAAFAVSGAIVGIKKQMDLFGVIVLGVCTAVGGGIVRDVILGVTPPATFHDPVYTLTAAAVSVLMFLPHVRARVGRHVYACASIIGALICALCWNRLGANAAMLFGAAAIVVLRLLAAYYHWSLPKSDYHDEPQTTTAAQTNQDSEIPQ